MRSLLASLTLFVLVFSPATAAPQDSVTAIVRQMKEMFEPARPSIRKVVISLSAEGEKVEWVAGQAFKKLPDGKRMLTVILAPLELRGNAFLVKEREHQPSVMWVYSPAIRRVRKLVPVDAYEHFLGTDFTYADLGFVRLHEKYKLLGEEEHAGVRAYKVEEMVPEERAYYSRLVIWVAADSLLPLQRDYYDVAGRLWKSERFAEVSTIDGVPTSLHIQMQDVQGKSSTELRVSEVDYDVEIPNTVFDPKELPGAIGSPLWLHMVSPPPQGIEETGYAPDSRKES